MSASVLEQPMVRVVLYEGEGAAPLAPAARGALLQALLDRGYAVTRVTPGGRVPAADGARVFLVGAFAEGVPTVEGGAGLCWQGGDPGGVLVAVDAFREAAAGPKPGAWLPWFPVIDESRCTNCLQCLSFCLFGVYGVSGESHIEVQNPDKCKTNCPACSRVCPEAAIMFPKYKGGPVNGAPVTDADVKREQMKVDISALLGGNLYQALRQRSEQARQRFSQERDEQVALQERRKCLAELQKNLDIPAEVLMSLPTPQEIQRRAVEAREKTEAARRQIEDSVARRLRDRDGGGQDGG